jgi:hypothetical protein
MISAILDLDLRSMVGQKSRPLQFDGDFAHRLLSRPHMSNHRLTEAKLPISDAISGAQNPPTRALLDRMVGVTNRSLIAGPQAVSGKRLSSIVARSLPSTASQNARAVGALRSRGGSPARSFVHGDGFVLHAYSTLRSVAYRP